MYIKETWIDTREPPTTLVNYTCMRGLKSYTQNYNLQDHLDNECVPEVLVPMVGSLPATRIQSVPEFLVGYTIPKTSTEPSAKAPLTPSTSCMGTSLPATHKKQTDTLLKHKKKRHVHSSAKKA